MSGYSKEEQERFNKMVEENFKLNKKKKKIKKVKRKRGLKRGVWK